ncbi:hypothetical protein HDC30_005773 [Pseudomonas sp. JAI115]|uniref:hypothetical protein n=1 Tax=Pseudomonas sp. JAI115 TaxID=2723061 RepID=UPI00160F7F26|nr:hypothetical protein [Pseudomonas sp. JAI115]MBB6158515.1 hypothetical protein [Pseudomonas sp. JAI115]
MPSLKKILLIGGLTALLGSQWEWLEPYAQGGYVEVVAAATGAYCLLPRLWRSMFRGLVNEVAAPNRLLIECAVDDPGGPP